MIWNILYRQYNVIPFSAFPSTPILESLPSIRQAKSTLEFEASASDNGATYSCATFSPKTMDRPMHSAFKFTLNVTCEFLKHFLAAEN